MPPEDLGSPVTMQVLDDAELAAIDERLAGARLLAGTVVDPAGVIRAKHVPVTRARAFHTGGMGASPTWNVFCIDNAIAFTPRFGVAGDLRLRADLSAARHLGDGLAWAPTEMSNQDGTPAEVCTRGLLRRATTALAGDGLTALVGSELEFVLTRADGSALDGGRWPVAGGRWPVERLRDERGAGHRAVPDRPPGGRGRRRPAGGTAPRRVRRAPVRVLPGAGRPAGRGGQRRAGQAPHRPGRTAARHGGVVLATALRGWQRQRRAPAPVADPRRRAPAVMRRRSARPDRRGQRRDRRARGRPPRGGGSARGLGAVRRPAAPRPLVGRVRLLGLENREAAVRYCAATSGNPHGASVEVKCVDPSANPYLATAVLLGLARDGISRGLPLPPEVTGDPADLGVALLAADQATALATLDTSPLVARLLGEDLLEALSAVRHHELDTYGKEDPDVLADRFRFAWSV